MTMLATVIPIIIRSGCDDSRISLWLGLTIIGVCAAVAAVVVYLDLRHSS